MNDMKSSEIYEGNTGGESSLGDEFLISDYEFFQKGFELWANHFMGAFYLWTGVVVVPTTATAFLSNLGATANERVWLFGLVCIGVAIIGWYISLKMFDVRRAQLTYAQQLNKIRLAAYEKMGVTARYRLEPYGRDANLQLIARRDFVNFQAIAMSAIHGSYVGIGLSCILVQLLTHPVVIVPGILLGVLVLWRNYVAYLRMVPGKL